MFCKKCGNKISTRFIKNEGDIHYCETCEEFQFPKTNLAMIAILVNENNQICLINQNRESKYKILIAGFIKQQETLEECVIREIKEEVGIDVFEVNYLRSHFYANKDTLMVGYYAKTNQVEFNLDLDEVDNATWYSPDDCLNRMRQGSIAYQLVEQYLDLSKGV